MSGRKLRWLGLGLVTSAGAGVLALTAIMNSAFAYGDVPVATPAVADPAPFDPSIGLIMGGSSLPIPGQQYVGAAQLLYLNNPFMAPNPNFPGVETPGVLANGLFTPEGLYPLTGPKSLPLNYPVGAQGYSILPGQTPAEAQTSVGQGVTILNDNIQANLAAGEPTTVFGYSQSATIAGEEMKLLDPSGTPSNLPVQFLLIGDPSNPNGGLLERFGPSDVPGLARPELTLPSMGLQFDGATPANDFTTVIYTREYDGFADFPRYPINLPSDLNAFLGIQEIHGHYLDGTVTPQQIAPESPTNPDGAIQLATQGPTMTTYYMLPTENLPLVGPLRDIPVIGNPVADLLQPDLRLLVNLGYDNPNPLEGWDAGPANVPTPFGLFPSFSQVLGALKEVPSQTQLGIQNFIGDISSGNLLSLNSLTSGPSGMASMLSDPTALLSSLSSPTDIANGISAAGSTLYATGLPTADIANALVTSIPAYNVALAMDNLSDPLNAVGLPIAADTALLTLAGGFEFEVLQSAITTAAGDLGLGGLADLIPF